MTSTVHVFLGKGGVGNCLAFLCESAQFSMVLHARYQHLPIVEVPLFPHEVRGANRLRLVARELFAGVPLTGGVA